MPVFALLARHAMPPPARAGEPSLLLSRSEESDVGVRLVKDMLMQRAAQTQLYYYMELRDDFRRNWLVRYGEEKGTAELCNVEGRMLHAHDALGPVSWREYLFDMLLLPDEVHSVTVVWGNRRRGGSPNNPYMPEVPPHTYQASISPASVAAQLITVRELLAAEWSADLELIERDNAEIRRSRKEVVEHEVDDQARFQYAVAPSGIGVGGGGDSSPLRHSSYDLLKKALTRHAVRVLKRELHDEPSTRHAAVWLGDFYLMRGAAFRSTEHNVAVDFIGDLMNAPLSICESSGDPDSAKFIDPLALAERLLDVRQQTAVEWREVLADVPSDHIELHRARLQARTGAGGIDELDTPRGDIGV